MRWCKHSHPKIWCKSTYFFSCHEENTTKCWVLAIKVLYLQVGRRKPFYIFNNKTSTSIMAEHNDLGRWGEEQASLFLEEQGYHIIARDWKIGKRDLDIVALSPEGDQLVIVEVKTRSSTDYQLPEQAVDVRKMRNLAVAANAYVKAHAIARAIRFDIISVIGGCSAKAERIEHLCDAFNPMLIL